MTSCYLLHPPLEPTVPISNSTEKEIPISRCSSVFLMTSCDQSFLIAVEGILKEMPTPFDAENVSFYKEVFVPICTYCLVPMSIGLIEGLVLYISEIVSCLLYLLECFSFYKMERLSFTTLMEMHC